MSTVFTFGFEPDDIDQATEKDNGFAAQDDNGRLESVQSIPPQLHTLHNILLTFPSHLSFKTTSLPGGSGAGIEIPRRDLFDIRAQLMAEDGELSRDPIAGLSADDVVPNVYEGGFKTWECSVDLSDYICSNIDVHDGASMKDATIVELGAGSALPTTAILRKWLSQRLWYSEEAPRLQICLADYNCSVLELGTFPNLFLVTKLCNQPISGHEIETEPETLKQFETDLSNLGIDVCAISGSWTPEFTSLIPPIARSSPDKPHETIVLASETIYSPASIQAFTQVLMSILRKAEEEGSNAKALVAAKRVYFGVGGGTDEFLRVLGDLGGQSTVLWETQGAGVGRVIIEVTRAPPC